MLIPLEMFTVREYDITCVITPTSRFSHDSDTVIAIVEMLLFNDQAKDISFPFVVLNTDPGIGAESTASVAPTVLNGSRPVELSDDDVDEVAFAEVAVQRAQQAGVTDPAKLERVRQWAIDVLRRAERTKVGRTKIKPGEQRRIVLQQRIRVKPSRTGDYVLELIAPSPLATLAAGGRVSVVVILPWEDSDVHPVIIDRTQGFDLQEGNIKFRRWVAWQWMYDPVFRVLYRYQ